MVKRRYDASRRQAQARHTRRAVLDAAATLFVDPGYAATRLSDVADLARVSVPSIHAHFGTKRGLLSALLDVTVAGDDEPVPVPQRAFVAEIDALPDVRARLERYAVHLAEVLERLVDVQLALAAAATADADAAAIWQKGVDERRAGMRMFGSGLVDTGQVRPDLTVEQVADVLCVAMDVRNYDWLVRRCGWTPSAFRRWYVDSVAGVLL